MCCIMLCKDKMTLSWVLLTLSSGVHHSISTDFYLKGQMREALSVRLILRFLHYGTGWLWTIFRARGNRSKAEGEMEARSGTTYRKTVHGSLPVILTTS